MNTSTAREISVELKSLRNNGQLKSCKYISHHGTTSVLKHCIHVAAVSCQLADLFHLKVDRSALIRGALLHDYYLYDWHVPEKWHKLHGFSHPYVALTNAKRDYYLSEREKNIIVRHMFPLVPIPPSCTEAWLVCLADKICATKEVISDHI